MFASDETLLITLRGLVYNRLSSDKGGTIMKVTGVWMGVLAIILGILVLAFPDLIRWFIGVGLIVLGILALVRK